MSRIKSVLLQCLIVVLAVSSVLAQNPANFHLIYGNRDASPMVVHPSTLIWVPVWAATDPTPGNADSVTFMSNPLRSRDLYITDRLGGYCVVCDDCCNFTDPEHSGGYTTQTLILSTYLQDPRIPGIYTHGDTILIAYFQMEITADSTFVGQTVDVFSEGVNPAVGYTLWGMQDGVRGVNPTITFSQFYFSPCFYIPGDVNGDTNFDGRDIVFAVNYFKGFGPEPPYSCECEEYGLPKLAADANGDCHFSGIDVTFSVNYLKGIGPGPRRCPDC